MTLSSQMALEDVGALFLGPSFLTADPMGLLLDPDEEEALSPSPSHSFSYSSSSPVSFSSPPPSPPPPPPTYPSLLGGSKPRDDPLSFPWFSASDLLHAHVRAEPADDDGKDDDAFTGMEWMTEKIDLSDFDLDSLIGSCASDEPAPSPEELLASLDSSHMDLDPMEMDPFAAASPLPPAATLSLPDLFPHQEAELQHQEVEVVPEVEEVEVKSEPSSPLSPPHSPAYTLDLELGSEVDVLEAAGKATTSSLQSTSTITVIPADHSSVGGNIVHQTGDAAPIVIALPTTHTHFVLVLTPPPPPPPKDESTTLVPLPTAESSVNNKTSPVVASNDCEDSDSGIESIPSPPPQIMMIPSPPSIPASSPSSSAAAGSGSSRTKPYSKPEPNNTSSGPMKAPRVKSVSGAAPKVVEKKIKKMEQNKTAATRYRQKKRVEQEVLLSECSVLEQRNDALRDKVESISREITYLKDLMEEVRNAKHRRTAKTPSTVA